MLLGLSACGTVKKPMRRWRVKTRMNDQDGAEEEKRAVLGSRVRESHRDCARDPWSSRLSNR